METMLERIDGLCKQKGISIARLCEILGFSGNSIYKWDKSSPSIEKVIKVADYFDVSVEYILGRSEYIDIQRGTPEWDDYIALQRARKEHPERYKIAKEIIQAGFDHAYSDEKEPAVK